MALGVIGLLLALILPALRAARETTKDSLDLANLRSTHQQFYQWGAEHRDHFLNAGPPPPERDFYIEYGGCTLVIDSYFIQQSMWPLVLANWTGEGSPAWHSTNGPTPEARIDSCRLDNVQYVTESAYHYARGALASPELWMPELWDGSCYPSDYKRYYRFVRWAEAAFPAQKGLLYDSASPPSDGRHPAAVVFVDGSAQLMDLNDSTQQAIGPCDFEAVVRTYKGILGRDFAR